MWGGTFEEYLFEEYLFEEYLYVFRFEKKRAILVRRNLVDAS
jgi:hypothetical protein